MAYVTKTKDPDAILDFEWDWGGEGWLTDGDTIATADFTVYNSAGGDIPADDTTPVAVDSSSSTPTTATAWVSGGTLGSAYLVTCRITTDGGRTDDRTLKLTIKQK